MDITSGRYMSPESNDPMRYPSLLVVKHESTATPNLILADEHCDLDDYDPPFHVGTCLTEALQESWSRNFGMWGRNGLILECGWINPLTGRCGEHTAPCRVNSTIIRTSKGAYAGSLSL
jgi:hypothetical protein